MTRPDRARRAALAAAALTTLSGCSTGRWALPAVPTQLPTPDLPPPAPREFRGVWVATVANIDWPSKPGLPAAQQQAEMLVMLDRAREIGLNAIVLQVRPTADAIYPSALEPWTEYLNGEQGRAPEPAYDPLAMWVHEAHRRGLELHAWFNPYRARHATAKSAAAPSHVSVARPELVRRYGEQLWLDPAEPAAAAHTLAVVADVVKRYDIDGVHIDDYFYPYPVAANGADVPFPDDGPWQRYRERGGTLTRDDWRRDNVDRLVQAMAETVHFVKPHVRFGISPFGLGRPDLRPPGIEGFSQYDKLYADVERWVEKGWFDYLAPQLYWAIDRKPQAFAVLLDYWAAQLSSAGGIGGPKHLWPGLFTSSVAGPNSSAVNTNARNWPAEEIVNQVGHVRQRAAARGHIHFSMVALMQDRAGVASALRSGPYREAALAPASPWLDNRVPLPPSIQMGFGQRAHLVLAPTPFVWALWKRSGGQWRFSTQPGPQTEVDIAGCDALVASSVSGSGQESARVALRW